MVNSTGAWTVTNSLTLTQGTWNAGAFTHLIAGAWNSTGVNFTFNSNTSTIQLTSANPNISTKGLVIDPFYNLTTNNGGDPADRGAGEQQPGHHRHAEHQQPGAHRDAQPDRGAAPWPVLSERRRS